MPEGDTAFRTAAHLDAALAGLELVRSDFRVPSIADVDLAGQTIEGVVSRGKHLLTRIGEHSLHTHLKMEGSWHLYRPESRWRRPAHTARVVLVTQPWSAVGFDLGTVELVSRADEAALLNYLGPDLLGADWDADRALLNLLREPGTPVHRALLDQRNLAGLGNEYANELCFLRGVLPEHPIGEVTRPEELVALAVRLIRANRDRTARTFTGIDKPGQRAWVFSRDGKPCRRCGTTIRRGRLGESAITLRDTYWCPRCQS